MLVIDIGPWTPKPVSFQKIHVEALDKLVDAGIITSCCRDKIKVLLNSKKEFSKGRKYVLDLLAMEHELMTSKK